MAHGASLQVVRLVRSLQRVSQRVLFPGVSSPEQLVVAARDAPFVLLAHGTEPAGDPTLSYANSAAMALFALDEGDLGCMPTRLTAAAQDQAARTALLAEVAAKGFSTSYSGPRVSRDGRAFTIRDATVWNVHACEDGGSGEVCGQAALFSSWTPAPTPTTITSHVRVRVRPEHAQLFLTLTMDNARRSSTTERGCIRFDILRSSSDEGAFTLVETFASADDMSAHKLTPHYLRWRDAVAALMVEPRSATSWTTPYSSGGGDARGGKAGAPRWRERDWQERV